VTLRVTLALACLLAAIVAAPVAGLSASITLDQSAPRYGDSVTFTEVYGTVYHGRQPQYPNQPSTQLDCLQNGVRVYSENTWTLNKTNLGHGWWQSVAGPFVLAAYGANGLTWSSGAASCSATLYYFDGSNVLHTLAQTQFEVAA
jgi:hypothetical protein